MAAPAKNSFQPHRLTSPCSTRWSLTTGIQPQVLSTEGLQQEALLAGKDGGGWVIILRITAPLSSPSAARRAHSHRPCLSALLRAADEEGHGNCNHNT